MQTFEYPMWSPHPKAKLFKRYTGNQPVAVGSEVITVQGNRYVYSGSFKWVETTTEEKQNEQPLGGLIIENSYLTIKTNSLKEFTTDDVIELPKDTRFAGLWVIVDGMTVDYAYTPKQVQTFQHLPLSSLG